METEIASHENLYLSRTGGRREPIPSLHTCKTHAMNDAPNTVPSTAAPSAAFFVKRKGELQQQQFLRPDGESQIRLFFIFMT